MARQAAALAPAWDSTSEVERAADICMFLADVQQKCGASRTALSDDMMAPDFEDLTGQLILKITALMQRTETDLLELLADVAPDGTLPGYTRNEITAGPGATGHVVLDQQNVDDLLVDPRLEGFGMSVLIIDDD